MTAVSVEYGNMYYPETELSTRCCLLVTKKCGTGKGPIASARLEKVFVKTHLHTSPIVVKKDVLTESIEKDPPWPMMFAEDLVLFAMTREEVEEDLETWRVVFERHGLNISRTKTEYLQ